MSLHANARWIVTYDIANPRRLARLFRFMKNQGTPVQYSVFRVEASAAKMSNLVTQIAQLIDASEDDVRAYRLPERTWKITLGQSMLPDDLMPGGSLLP